MIKDALQYLVGLGNKEIKQVNGQDYATGNVQLITEPIGEPIHVQSLSGLVGYLKSNFDSTGEVMIHVKDPTTVIAFSTINSDVKRNRWIVSDAFVPDFQFDRFYNAEAFNIKLQSCFLRNEDSQIVLKVVGNIREENVQTIGDDGISQSVTAKTGIAQVGDVKVPNPIMVAPYRTFTEVEQPESKFVFRMRDGAECALFEADGGAWQLEAMDNIKDYLSSELEELIQDGKVHIIA
ncbi:hypothetical protein [Paraliobacillus zengyii]|uniref:hypothetical protein n=1 Tax=Paraliobacillus zengyii TaxID=2213194 RepID=UPI000DD39004|nr:hypothetical protein [Paraliobacillus zengyii]